MNENSIRAPFDQPERERGKRKFIFTRDTRKIEQTVYIHTRHSHRTKETIIVSHRWEERDGGDRRNKIETRRGGGERKGKRSRGWHPITLLLHPFWSRFINARGPRHRGKEEKEKRGRRDFNYRRANSQPDAPTGQITPVILPSFIAGGERKREKSLNAAWLTAHSSGTDVSALIAAPRHLPPLNTIHLSPSTPSSFFLSSSYTIHPSLLSFTLSPPNSFQLLPLPPLRSSAREWKRALDRCLLSPPVSTRREGWFSRATRNNYATKGDTHPNATCRGMHFNALQADKMRRGWLWEFRDDLASWMNVVQFTSFPPDIIYSFPTFRIFLLLASGFFIYFSAGENLGGEKRRDGKVPLSREGSRRLEFLTVLGAWLR